MKILRFLALAVTLTLGLAIPTDIVPTSNNATLDAALRGTGSSVCKKCSNIKNVKNAVDQLRETDWFYDHQFIACDRCPAWLAPNHALCVFPQRIGSKTVSAYQAKNAMTALMANGCHQCGNFPLYSDNKKDGMITVNFVTNGCQGICNPQSPIRN
ncbi:hypothetical protein EJ04DRAFT_569172 [Polyplosphaeria fusca]|uniref:Killer toxin Kp4 domain-containing protein n=1 Tax=Polyplosphaeria fusca TaxID=682080 RepID=A0A9P4UXG7_9PLEO|nr:hypothetical protein EJ04DRAFT_569172 [Polyplosphaeria fusca]